MHGEHDWIRARLLAQVVDGPVGDKAEHLIELRKSEWSPLFERLMRNRLLVGRFRYAKMGSPEKGSYDCVGSAIARLQRYQSSGNLEHLVDAANLCLVEFEHGNHPERHFAAADDAEHVEKI